MINNSILKNKTIVITRPMDAAESLKTMIEKEGGCPILFPTIKIVPTDTWDSCDRAIKNLDRFDWIVFSSKNSAYYFLQRLSSHKKSIGMQKIGVIGAKTAAYVRSCNLQVHLIPEQYSASGFLSAINGVKLKKNSFLLPTSDIGRNELSNGLSAKGHQIFMVEVYRTATNYELDVQTLQKKIHSRTIDCFTFYSPSAFKSFLELIDRETRNFIRKINLTIASIGNTTTAAIRAEGFVCHICATKSSDERMLEAIKTYFIEKDVNHVTVS